jgi:hypothetical protein
MKKLCIFALATMWACHAQAQADPSWWSGVIRSGDSHAIAENYKPANLGQLKHFADKAREHLNARLPAYGGAGAAIEAMVAGWTAAPLDSNYAPVNLGQLKAVADKFYTRLDLINFNYRAQLTANGYVGAWTGNRPWNESLDLAANYAPANLGQVKILFCFEVPAGQIADINGNGIADSQEDLDGDGIATGQEVLQGTDPLDATSALNPPAQVSDTGGLNQLSVFTPLL